jgi:hypothetical protein
MDTEKILEEIINNGFYEKDGLKFIYSLPIYYSEYEKIIRTPISKEHITSFPFAVFRGNLYNFNLQSSLKNDYKLYCKYLYNRRIVNLQLNTILLAQSIKFEYSTDFIKNQFEKEILNLDKTMIINSFHYASSKLILPYFLINNCDVYIIATPKIIKDNEEKTEIFTSIWNTKFNTESKAYFVNAEDYLSLIKLYEALTKRHFDRKTILLIFPDGNIGADRKNENNKNLYKIEFHGAKIHIRQGIYSLAKILQAPVFSVIGESYKEYVKMNVNSFLDFASEHIQPDDFTAMLFRNFEKFIDRENMSKWECMIYLHSWLDKNEIIEDEIVDKKSFDKERYTYIKIDEKKYIFDSKYYLSMEVDNDNIKKNVLRNNFYK